MHLDDCLAVSDTALPDIMGKKSVTDKEIAKRWKVTRCSLGVAD